MRETGIIETIDSMVPESADNPGPFSRGQVAEAIQGRMQQIRSFVRKSGLKTP